MYGLIFQSMVEEFVISIKEIYIVKASTLLADGF